LKRHAVLPFPPVVITTSPRLKERCDHPYRDSIAARAL
jgi:hypothetical protein